MIDNAFSTIRLPFRMHFIRMHGPEAEPMVRVLLVDTCTQTIYEGFGCWSQCRRWIALVSECPILADQLTAIEKLLEMKRLATIQGMRVSLHDLQAVGFRRVDGQSMERHLASWGQEGVDAM